MGVKIPEQGLKLTIIEKGCCDLRDEILPKIEELIEEIGELKRKHPFCWEIEIGEIKFSNKVIYE